MRTLVIFIRNIIRIWGRLCIFFSHCCGSGCVQQFLYNHMLLLCKKCITVYFFFLWHICVLQMNLWALFRFLSSYYFPFPASLHSGMLLLLFANFLQNKFNFSISVNFQKLILKMTTISTSFPAVWIIFPSLWYLLCTYTTGFIWLYLRRGCFGHLSLYIFFNFRGI